MTPMTALIAGNAPIVGDISTVEIVIWTMYSRKVQAEKLRFRHAENAI